MWIDIYDADSISDFDRDIRQGLHAGVNQVLGRGPSEKAQVCIARARWVQRDLGNARRDLAALQRLTYESAEERKTEALVAELEAELERLLGVILTETQS